MSMKTQMQIMQNAEEARYFASDLMSWEDEMKQMDDYLRKTPLAEGKTEDYYEELENDEKLEGGDNANKLKEKGNQLVKLGKWREAIEEYDKAIELDDQVAAYFGNKAFCYLQLNDLEEAERNCSIALDLDSSYSKVLLRRALIRKRRGLLKEAAIDLDNLLQVEPDNKTAWQQYKDIYPKLKDLNYYNQLKTQIREPDVKVADADDEAGEVDGSKLPTAASSSLTTLSPEENNGREMKSTSSRRLVEDKPELFKTKATNEVKTKFELSNYSENIEHKNNKFNASSNAYLEIRPLKTKPAHLRSKLSFKRIEIVDIVV